MNSLAMARVKILCGHEVRMEETHMITLNIESHRCELAKDQEVKRGRKVAKGYSNPRWIQSPEPKATRPGARTGGWGAWAQSWVSCCFQFVFTTPHGHGAWMDNMQPPCIQTHKPSALRSKGRTTWQIQPDLPSAQCLWSLLNGQAAELSFGSQGGGGEYFTDLGKNY